MNDTENVDEGVSDSGSECSDENMGRFSFFKNDNGN